MVVNLGNGPPAICPPPRDRMSHLAERIRKARRDAGLTQTELGLACGVKPQSVHGWERGHFAPNHIALRIISEVTNTSLEWLISGQSTPDNSTTDEKSVTLWVGRVVPSINWQHILPFISKQLQPDATARSHFLCGPRSFQTIIPDKSNEPQINQGDSVVIDPDVKPSPGDTVLLDLDGTLYLRRYRPRDDHIELVPANPDWPALKVGLEQANIIGVVTEASRPFKI